MPANLSLTPATRFPKTYPTVNPPIFSIEKPISGLNSDQVTKLTHAIHNEAKTHVGSEMVFQVTTIYFLISVLILSVI
jgi:eukaryotic translation initiation factor 2-alpha kinase 4